MVGRGLEAHDTMGLIGLGHAWCAEVAFSGAFLASFEEFCFIAAICGRDGVLFGELSVEEINGGVEAGFVFAFFLPIPGQFCDAVAQIGGFHRGEQLLERNIRGGLEHIEKDLGGLPQHGDVEFVGLDSAFDFFIEPRLI